MNKLLGLVAFIGLFLIGISLAASGLYLVFIFIKWMVQIIMSGEILGYILVAGGVGVLITVIIISAYVILYLREYKKEKK